MSLAIDRDVAAKRFRELFDVEFAFVCRALRRLGVLEADIGDVAQELFVLVHKNIAELDPKRSVRPWLYGFAVRLASNYRRLARHRENAPISSLAPAANLDADRAARDLVLRALHELDFDRRTVLVMHDLEGFASPEIAAIVHVPVNTVYSRLRLARQDFREAIARLETA